MTPTFPVQVSVTQLLNKLNAPPSQCNPTMYNPKYYNMIISLGSKRLSYGEKYDNLMPGDLVMSTVGECKQPALKMDMIGRNNIILCMMTYFT